MKRHRTLGMVVTLSAVLYGLVVPGWADEKTLIMVGDFTDAISILSLDSENGKLTRLFKQKEHSRPSYLITDPKGEMLYAVSEYATPKKFWGSGSVSAYRLDKETGKLDFVNKQKSGGIPCYLTMDKDRRFLLCASFGGSVQVYPIAEDGSLRKATSNIEYVLPPDADKKARAHAHSILFSPDQKFIFVQNQGADRIYQYKFDHDTSKLTPNEPAYIEFSAQTGPRHMTFHPSGKYAYVVNEKASSVFSFNYDSESGTLKQSGSILLAENSEGGGADIHCSGDGKFLYASGRNGHSILITKVQPNGTLEHVEFFKTGEMTPRSFVLVNNDKFLLVVHRRSNDLITFHRNAKTGKLTEVTRFQVTEGAEEKKPFGAVFVGAVND